MIGHILPHLCVVLNVPSSNPIGDMLFKAIVIGKFLQKCLIERNEFKSSTMIEHQTFM